MFQKTLRRLGLAAVVVGVAMLLSPAPAYAQRGGGSGGGGGGGGVQRISGSFGLKWAAPPIDGVAPVVVGSGAVSTYITTLGVDVRVGSVNLPDNTPLTVTVYCVDFFTGKPWPPKQAGVMTLSRGRGLLLYTALWTTAPRGIPLMSSVVITAPDGTVIAVGTP